MVPCYFDHDHDSVENLNDYKPGGYHPGDIYPTRDNPRYRVLHKLGYGSFATIWLARDIAAKLALLYTISSVAAWRSK
jgi:serine/threonine-protein kinase SRPK3